MKNEDKIIRDVVNEEVKDMTLEELMMAVEDQNDGLYSKLNEIVVSQIDVIRLQQEEISKNRDLVESLLNITEKLQAQITAIISKQKDLEEFALIAGGIKAVNETDIGKDVIMERAERYIKAQEDEEKEIADAKKSLKESKEKFCKKE